MTQEKGNWDDRVPGKPLAHKTALVTGGSRGIGRGIAERLAADGAIVAISYNANKEAADETVAAIERSGGQAFAVQADLGNASAIPALFDQLDVEFGKRNGDNGLDLLINNAGSFAWYGIKNASPSNFDDVMAVYVRAPFFLIQAALPRLMDGGRIINISSANATQPNPDVAVYSMAKASLNNLTHSLAVELGPRDITVNVVSPGWTETDMNASVREDAEIVKFVHQRTALGRFGKPADIASVVAFVASGEGRWITGQVIEASGGWNL